MWNPLKEFNINSLSIYESKKLEVIFFETKERVLLLKDIQDLIKNFFQNLSYTLKTKSGVKIYSMNIKFPNNVIKLLFFESSCYIPCFEKHKNSVVLWNVFIPKNLRNLGLTSKIFDYLETLAKNKRKCFVVQMIMSDALLHICKKRAYKQRPPFSMYFIPIELEESISKKINKNSNLEIIQLNKIKINQGLNKDVLKQIYVDFKKEFESNFHINNKNGTIKRGWEDLQGIENFVNKYSLIILSSSSLIIEHPNIQRTRREDIDTMYENKNKLLKVYSVCFDSYVKVCSALKVKIENVVIF